MLEFMVLALATWRISYMLVVEDGPYDILDKIRRKLGVEYASDGTPYSENTWGNLFTCVWCISVWVGTLFFVIDYINMTWIGIPFALSAISILANEVLSWLVHQNTRS